MPPASIGFTMKLREIVVEAAIVPCVKATKRDAVIGELVDALVAAGVISEADRPSLVKESIARERKGSTGFGHGVAVPHARSTLVTQPRAAVGLVPGGVEFNALDRQPVYSVVFLLSPAGNPDAHLSAMETVFGALSQESFRRFLRQSTNAADVLSLLDEVDGLRAQR